MGCAACDYMTRHPGPRRQGRNATSLVKNPFSDSGMSFAPDTAARNAGAAANAYRVENAADTRRCRQLNVDSTSKEPKLLEDAPVTPTTILGVRV